MAKATKLTRLDTRGVAIVDKGANGKRIALAKASADGKTFEEALLDAIVKGDMPLDDAAVEDMGQRAGLDAQAIETLKAIMKLAHVYADSAAFNALLKQQFGGAATGEQPQPGQKPGAEQPQPGQKPGDKPGEQEASPGELQADQAGTEPDEGSPKEEQGDQGEPGGAPKEDPKKKPPFAKSATAAIAEGDNMDEKQVKEMIAKAAADAAAEVKKAADAQIAELNKANAELVAVSKAQETQIKAQADVVQKMQDDAKLAVWVSKADKELKEIPGETPESLGQQLFDLEKVKPELATKAFEAFKKTAAALRASGLFSPSGIPGGAPAAAGSAEAEMEKLAGELVAKTMKPGDTPEIARARAEVAIAKSHPELYKRYCDEKDRAAKRS